jgi:diphthamide synthase (EF-2-diphthine--ammonia ligase)
VAVGWSGGKDSTLALYSAVRELGLSNPILVTTYSEEFRRVSMHGVRLELLREQARCLGLDLLEVALPSPCSDEEYQRRMVDVLQGLREMGVGEMVFGDIFLEDVRRYREKNLEQAGFKVFSRYGDSIQKSLHTGLPSWGSRRLSSALTQPKHHHGLLDTSSATSFSKTSHPQ